MAALECNNGQDGFSPTENGDALPEEKSLSIDYSEDLWLANSEDSSGPYAQQPNKVVAQGSAHSAQDSYSNATSAHQPQAEAHSNINNSNYSEAHAINPHSQTWSEDMIKTEEEVEETALQPATTYINGSSEHNGMDFSSSGDEKDFAQLVPAGSYVDGGAAGGYVDGGAAVENQDKTFTSLMPAAALGVNGEIQQGFTTMLNSNQEGIVYYGTNEHIASEESSTLANQGTNSVSYEQSAQMSEANGEEGGDVEDAGGNMYVSMNNLNTENQAGSGQFAVLSPAMINMTTVSSEDQTYTTCVSGGAYHNISTLPFVQNGAYSSQSSFSPYHQTTSTLVSGEDSQQQHALQQSDYSSDQASFASETNVLTASLQQSAIDYQDDGQDEDGDDQDMEEESMEYSEFCCPVCSEGFPDQATLDDHVNNHPPLKSFVCETCGKGFATRRYLKYHRKNHCKRASSYEGRNDLDENDPNGEVKRFSCNVCSRPFRVLKCMKVHKKKKHGIMKEFTCQNCAVTFGTSQELIDHSCEPKSAPSTPQIIQYTPPPLALPAVKKKRKLKQAKPACDICGKTFSDRISVDIHRVKHIEEELYPCDMCGDEDGVDPNHLAVHFRIRFFTDDNQHILEDQKAAVASQDTRSDDGSSVSATPVHNPGTPLPGSSTPQSAPATPIYIPATPIHAPGTPASSQDILEHAPGQADQSGYIHKFTEYTDAHGQTVHVSNYIVNQNDTLLVSDHTMLTDQHLEQQQLVASQHIYNANFEEGEVIHDASGSVMAVTPKKKKWKRSKIHMCDICNKAFGDTAKLELHYKSNHLHDRPYQCDVCEKSFFTKWKLQRHMLSHLEQKPHSCPMCSKSFVERGKLEAHYRTHLGTKPYKCDQCPKAFTVKSQLSIHQRRIHSTDQPFGCLVCGKAFLWKSGLDKHMRKHTREKPFICDTCGMKYSNKANLIVHMSKAHNQAYVDSKGQ